MLPKYPHTVPHKVTSYGSCFRVHLASPACLPAGPACPWAWPPDSPAGPWAWARPGPRCLGLGLGLGLGPAGPWAWAWPPVSINKQLGPNKQLGHYKLNPKCKRKTNDQKMQEK